MSYILGNRSKQRMEGVDSRLIEIAELAITITVIDFGIPADGGLRTARRQRELFEVGSSKADGFKKKSHHQTGRALDFYAYINGQASWDRKSLAIIACAFLQSANKLGYPLEWGGLFKNFTDMPHVQLGEE